MTLSPKRVALLVHTATGWARGLLKGVSSFMRETAHPWEVFLEPRSAHEQLRLPEGFRPDGVILRATHPDLEQSILDQQIPAVNVSWLVGHGDAIPKVLSDEVACAQLGIGHLRDHGYANLAYYGPDANLSYSNKIRRAFDDLPGSFYYADSGEDGVVSSELADWIEMLPKPVGILAWDTAKSKLILDCCAHLRLHVPNDVGIVCIEHDDLLASMSRIPLTSIDQNPMSVGYEAARLLESLMDGRDPPSGPTLIKPHGLVFRQSTDVCETDDKIVRSALEFINNNYAKPVRVLDVCGHLGISRRQLEQRFKVAINSTPANELKRVRLERAKQLLTETDSTLDKIATLCGYDYPEVMTRAFKQVYGLTPGEFRRSR